MGVSFYATRLPDEDAFDCGYITFGMYRRELSKSIGDDKFGAMYNIWYGGIVSGDEVSAYVDNDDIGEAHRDLVESGVMKVGMTSSIGGRMCTSFFFKWGDFCDYVDKNMEPGLQNIFFCPDNEGKFSWQECRYLYNALKDVKVDHTCTHYGYQGTDKFVRNTHEVFLNMFRHCWKNRVVLFWS